MTELAHPHNDYLRLLHDYGLVGLALFLLAAVFLVCRLWAVLRERPTFPSVRYRIRIAAFLGLLALFVSMLTDNTVVYVFYMAPLGILVGIALAADTRRSNLARLAQAGKVRASAGRPALNG